MKKFAGLEETEVSDSKTGKDIAVSTTARLIFRKAWPEKYGAMRNARLNDEIAKDFSSNSGSVLHHFWINKADRVIGEIRAGSSSFFYISVVRGTRIDIITIQTSWIRPEYNPSEEEMEMGDE